MFLDIAPLAGAASARDPHMSKREVSSWDRPNRFARTGCLRLRIQTAHSSCFGPCKKSAESVNILAVGRQRSDYLKIVVASPRSSLSSSSAGRQTATWDYSDESSRHLTIRAFAGCPLFCTTSPPISFLFVVSFRTPAVIWPHWCRCSSYSSRTVGMKRFDWTHDVDCDGGWRGRESLYIGKDGASPRCAHTD